MTTVEGILDRVIQNLESDIELRKEDQELVKNLRTFVDKLKDLKSLRQSFTIVSKSQIFKI